MAFEHFQGWNITSLSPQAAPGITFGGGSCSGQCPPEPPVPSCLSLVPLPLPSWCLSLPEAEHFISSLLNSVRFLPPHSQTVQVPLAHSPSLPAWCQQQKSSKGHSAPSSRSGRCQIRIGARISRIDPWDRESVTGCQLNFMSLPQFSIHSLCSSSPNSSDPKSEGSKSPNQFCNVGRN